MKRREFVAGGAALALAASLPARAEDDPGNGWRQLIARLTGGRTPQPGRVHLELPRVADNGNAVALEVSVDGPERATRLHLVSDLNPYAHMATFRFGAGVRRAAVATRVKLAGTQRVFAIAELADGSVWSDVREVAVAFSACFEGPA